MRCAPILLSSVLLALAASPGLASTWELDPSHTYVGFTVRHMMVHDVKGNFGKVKGTVNWDEKDITKSTISVDIDPASISTLVQKRDDDLRSANFFEVAKFPTLTFKSTKIEKSGAGLKITGDLNMHGVTKPVVLDATMPTPPVKGPWGNTATAVKATGKVNRKDFGLTWNKAMETGGVLVSEEVNLVIELEMNPAQPAAPAK